MRKILLLIKSFLLITLGLSAQPLTSGLVFYIPIENNLLDYSGNGVVCTSNGTLTADRNGNLNSAYHFNGINQFMTITNSPDIQCQLPLSISFYVNFDQLGTTAFANNLTPSNYTGMWIGTNANGNIHLNIGDGGGGTNPNFRRSMSSTGVLSAGTWHHVVGVIRAFNDMDIYIDCINENGPYSGSGGINIYYSNNQAKVGIGASTSLSNGIYYMQGKIDELAFWNRSLSQGDIKKLCAGGLDMLITSNTSPDFNLPKIAVFPNPSSEKVNIRLPEGFNNNGKLQLLDMSGKIIFEKEFDYLEQMSIDLIQIQSGCYMVRLTNSIGEKISHKLIRS